MRTEAGNRRRGRDRERAVKEFKYFDYDVKVREEVEVMARRFLANASASDAAGSAGASSSFSELS